VGIRSPLKLLFACLIFAFGLWASQSEAQTRRAFLVGNQKYTDGYIVRLERTADDAKDLAKDLEDVGFDKKNIKVVTDIKNKSAFDKEFDAFLKTVNPGDFVLFYFSGHGFGLEAQRRNYLLFTDLKSPFTYTRGQMSEEDRRNSDLVRVRIPRYIDSYQTDEIPKSGVSTTEIETRLAEKNPGNVFMILDACRSLARNEPDQIDQQVTVKRGSESGSRLLTDETPPDKFMVLYAAQFGEQAVESFFSDLGRNSLFTEVLRTELPRPGQTIRGLANRVKLIVAATARDFGKQQEPEFSVPPRVKYPDEIQLVDSIGAQRFPLPGGNCEGSDADWKRIVKDGRKRDQLDRHIKRFPGCPSIPEAQREYIRLALTLEDKPEQGACDSAELDWRKISELADAKDPAGAYDPRKLAAVFRTLSKKEQDDLADFIKRLAMPDLPIDQKALVYLLNRHSERHLGCRTNELAHKEIDRIKKGEPKQEKSAAGVTPDKISKCDELAAADTDSARPPEVPGVPFEKLKADAEEAIKACKADSEKNERVARYLYNRARAYHALGLRPGVDDRASKDAFDQARDYYRRTSKAGYVSAFNDLAVLYEAGDVPESDDEDETPIKLFSRGAEQGHPIAMYNYALHLRAGVGIKRDAEAAAEWFSKAADVGNVSAMVELGRALLRGEGATSNPRRGMDWLITAANQGASRAKLLLGIYYYFGQDDRAKGNQSVNSVKPDATLSLLWFGRLAEIRDRAALRWLAELLQDGDGLSSPQPEVAERYWRLAAYAGDPFAQVMFADRLRRGSALAKPQYGSSEAADLLERAVVQGEAAAALGLAQIYRDEEKVGAGERGKPRNVGKAMAYAYRAIELAVLSEKDVGFNGERLPEIQAAHLLIELVKDPRYPEHRKLLTPDEIERLERYYGATDEQGKIRIRRLEVFLTCHVGEPRYNRRLKKDIWPATWYRKRTIWVWDWGRAESPTEFQFRNLERDNNLCTDNDVLRRTLVDIFNQAKKNQESFAALVDQKVRTAKGENNVPKKKERRGRGRRRG
jgi:TPR repeat protein